MSAARQYDSKKAVKMSSEEKKKKKKSGAQVRSGKFRSWVCLPQLHSERRMRVAAHVCVQTVSTACAMSGRLRPAPQSEPPPPQLSKSQMSPSVHKSFCVRNEDRATPPPVPDREKLCENFLSTAFFFWLTEVKEKDPAGSCRSSRFQVKGQAGPLMRKNNNTVINMCLRSHVFHGFCPSRPVKAIQGTF